MKKVWELSIGTLVITIELDEMWMKKAWGCDIINQSSLFIHKR
jgi:hypothetical protein